MPRISVLMTARNVERFIDESVSSILNQTYDDFELLIADDASTDGTWDRLESLARTDSRIFILKNEIQLGVSGSLNRILENARGEYIARMDADDIAIRERFELQLPILDGNKADFCGGWMSAFGNQREAIVKFPVEDEEIRAHLLFWNPIAQPTVLLRRELLKMERYSLGDEWPRDYELWQRLSLRCRMYNLPKVLLRYRRHPGQTASTQSRRQIEGSARLAVRYLEMTGIEASDKEKALHAMIRHPDPPATWEEVSATETWLLKLAESFEGSPLAQAAIAQQWYRYCLKAASRGVRAYHFFRLSPLHRMAEFSSWQDRAIFALGALHVRYGSWFYKHLAALSPAAKQ